MNRKVARHYLGIDLGAESGRVMLGRLEPGKLRLEEVVRFPNEPVRFPAKKSSGSMWWAAAAGTAF